MTIELSPQLEHALSVEAERRGISPDALVAELITAQLPASNEPLAADAQSTGSSEELPTRTMYDRWKAHLESIKADSTPRTGPTNLSQDTGRRFAELLEEKRRQGRL
jgi:hypothetical protein